MHRTLPASQLSLLSLLPALLGLAAPSPHPVWGTESSLQEVTLVVEDGTAQGGLEQQPPKHPRSHGNELPHPALHPAGSRARAGLLILTLQRHLSPLPGHTASRY